MEERGIIQVFGRKDIRRMAVLSKLSNTGLKIEPSSWRGEWTIQGKVENIQNLLKYLDKIGVYYETTFPLPTIADEP